MSDRPPKLGAAMRISGMAKCLEWLLDGQRDLEIQDAFYPEVLDADWRSRVSEARSLLKGHEGRLGVHGPFINLTIMAQDPRVRTLVAGRLRQGLEFAAELGATHMVVHSPFAFFGSPLVPHSPADGLGQEIRMVQKTLAQVLPFAEEIGCALMIENCQDLRPEPLLDLVGSFGSESVRMSLDTGHAFLAHAAGGPPPDRWAREAGELLGHVHLNDNDGNADRHWPPGAGGINWSALFGALGELGHRPRLILELEDPRAAAGWLERRGLAS